MAYEHVVTARFFDIDRAGIVYFARIFDYCHVVYEELLGEIFGSMERLFAELGWGTPLVHCEADFRRPIRLGDRLRVRVTLEALDARRYTLRYDLEGLDGELRARATLVHAVIDMETFRGREVPEELVAGFERLGLRVS